jgi:phage shock protein C
MHCSNCGTRIEESFRYCAGCGASTADANRACGRYRLSRPREGVKLAGVCAGVARYLDMDVTLVRVIWILVTIFPPLPGIFAYIICWIVMPKDEPPLPRPFEQRPAQGTTPQDAPPQAT